MIHCFAPRSRLSQETVEIFTALCKTRLLIQRWRRECNQRCLYYYACAVFCYENTLKEKGRTIGA